MTQKKVFTVPLKRKRESKTDYRRRLQLLKSGKLRLVVRRSNKHIQAQIVKFGEEGDKIVESVHSSQLSSFGWKGNTGNIPAAYLTGYLLGKKAKGKEVIVDLGLQTPHHGSRLYALLKGAREAGLKFTVSEEIFPSDDRVMGNHIAAYADKADKEHFSGYHAQKQDPQKLPDLVKKTKERIENG